MADVKFNPGGPWKVRAQALSSAAAQKQQHAMVLAGLRPFLSPPFLSEIKALALDPNPQSFWEGVLQLALRLKQAEQLSAAENVLGLLTDPRNNSIPEEVKKKAKLEWNGIVGKGSLGRRFEFLASRLSKDATDPKTIVPMILGSMVGQVVSTAVLGRLAGTATHAWYARGLGPRLAAGILGYLAEVPVFALSQRLLSGPQEASTTDDLQRTAISLGTLKVFSYLGNKAALTSFPRLNQVALPQLALFGGILASHKLEEKMGLRPQVDGATWATDTLASMLSLSVGAYLGHRMLGPNYARWQQEMEWRTLALEKKLEATPRAKPWLSNPLLAPMWMALGVGGLGGGAPGKTAKTLGKRHSSKPSSSDPTAEILNRDLKLIRDEEKGLWKLEGLEENRAAAGALFSQAQAELGKAEQRFRALGEAPPLERRMVWHGELKKLADDQLSFWQGQIEASGRERHLSQARYLQDIGIGLRRLLGRISRLLAELYAEPLPGESLPAIGLRRPRPIQVLGLVPQQTDIIPTLVNFNVGFGEELCFRPHQIEALKRVRAWMEANREKAERSGALQEEEQDLLQGTIVMPVGGGKTRVMVGAFATAMDLGLFQPGKDKFLVINHTNQIHTQNLEVASLLSEYFQEKFGRPLKVSEYKALRKDLSGDLVVVSIPTVNQAEQRQAFVIQLAKELGPEGKIPAVAVDEVHHLGRGIEKGLESWQELLKGLRQISPQFFRLGFTATPTGKEGAVLYKKGVMELMRARVTPRTYIVPTPGIDLSEIPIRGGDFAGDELGNTLVSERNREKRHIPLFAALERQGLYRSEKSPSGKAKLQGVLCFGAHLMHARALAEDYQKYYAQAGEAPLRKRNLMILGGVDGKISVIELLDALSNYRSGGIDGLLALVSGKTKEQVRAGIFKAVETGEIEAVFSVDALVEGADLYMFTHQLGVRPTFSSIKKGQERGRISRRGPEEVRKDGRLLKDPPKVLFEVTDSYHRPGHALVPYGLVMGIPGYTEMKPGEAYDLMPRQPVRVEAIDPLGTVDQLIPEPAAPPQGPHRPRGPKPGFRPDLSPAYQNLAELLRGILEKDYQGDLETMALDLGEMPQQIELLLNGEGWNIQFWFLRRISTLLYQTDREIFLKAYNEGLGKEKGALLETDYEILQQALQKLEAWEGIDLDQGFKTSAKPPGGSNELVLTPGLLNDLHSRRLSDVQWRTFWKALYHYFFQKGQDPNLAPERQKESLSIANSLIRHLFVREAWPWQSEGEQEDLLFISRKMIAQAYGGILPQYAGIGGVPWQSESAPLTRWFKGENIKVSKGFSPKQFYDQIRAMLKGLGAGEKEVETKIEGAVFAEQGWPREADGPQEELRLLARQKVARSFDGLLTGGHGIVGLARQNGRSPIRSWLKGKKIEFSNRLTPQNFYNQIVALLTHDGFLSLAETEARIEAAVFAEQGWGLEANSAAETLRLLARQKVARAFGGVLPTHFNSIPGVDTSKVAVLSRWLRGEALTFSDSRTPKLLYDQIRVLLKKLAIEEKDFEPLMEAAVFEALGWPQQANSPQEDLLLLARLKVAHLFGGVLPAHTGLEGVPQQRKHYPVGRWLRGEQLKYGKGLNSPKVFYNQLRILLKGLGVDEAELENRIESAVFAEQGWSQEAGSKSGMLLLFARRKVARVFGGVFPEIHGIEGIPRQNNLRALSRWIQGDKKDLDANLIPQIRALLTHEAFLSPAEAQAFIDAALKDEGSPGT